MPVVSAEIVVRAPLEKVYAIAKDIERFPNILKDVEAVHILERSDNELVSEWHAVIPQFRRKVHWVERDVWDDEKHECRFEMVKGDFDRYFGVWVFEAQPEGTLMKLTVDYEYNVPLIGPLIQKVVLKAVQDNCQAMLEGIKAAAESFDKAQDKPR